MDNGNTADTIYEGESLCFENPVRCGAGGIDGVPPSGHGLPEFAQRFNHDNDNTYTETRVYTTRATDHCKVTWGTRMRRRMYEGLRTINIGPRIASFNLASCICGVSPELYDEMLKEEEFERDVRSAAHLDIHLEVESTGSREPISTRQLLEAQLAETGHPVNNIVYGDTLFVPESPPPSPAPAVSVASSGGTRPSRPRSGGRGGARPPRPPAGGGGRPSANVDEEEQRPTPSVPTPWYRPPAMFWDTVTVQSEDASDVESEVSDMVSDLELSEEEEPSGGPDARVTFNLLYPPIPPPCYGVTRTEVVTRPREARGLVLRQIVNGPRGATTGRVRRKVRTRQRVVSPVLVATMVAEVISRVGSLRDTPANRLVVERTALLRLREGEDEGDTSRKWTPEAVASYLPRVVHAYFACNVHADGVGTGVRGMWVDFRSWFRLTTTLRSSPMIFQ